MSSLQDRISQFRKMAEANPEDEIGHYRLGQHLMEAGEYAESIKSFQRTLELSPTFSRVFQFMGSAYQKMGQIPEAIDTWTKGWKVADERGDRLPRDEMARLLKENGGVVPEAVKVVEEYDGPDTGFRCQRPTCASGRRAHQLAKPPLPDEIGQHIYQKICADCWQDWFRNASVKVINELRIDLSTEFGQEEYDKYMKGFFGFEENSEPIPGPATAPSGH